jgi:hypothetical protein
LYICPISKRRREIMVKKRILNPNRIRHIDGGFSFIPHRFLNDGFVSSLSQKEFLLYLFLILVSDRYGISFYSYDAICSVLELCVDEYIEARDGLIRKDLIACDGTLFQVLDLPEKATVRSRPEKDPALIAQLIRKSLHEGSCGR